MQKDVHSKKQLSTAELSISGEVIQPASRQSYICRNISYCYTFVDLVGPVKSQVHNVQEPKSSGIC